MEKETEQTALATTRGAAGSATRGLATTGLVAARAVAALPGMERIEEHGSWEILSQMRLTIRAEISLNQFRVRDLLALATGQVFETLAPDTEDVPLKVGQVQMGWSEFEVVEQRMALR